MGKSNSKSCSSWSPQMADFTGCRLSLLSTWPEAQPCRAPRHGLGSQELESDQVLLWPFWWKHFWFQECSFLGLVRDKIVRVLFIITFCSEGGQRRENFLSPTPWGQAPCSVPELNTKFCSIMASLHALLQQLYFLQNDVSCLIPFIRSSENRFCELAMYD